MFYNIPTEPAYINTVWDDEGNKWEKVNENHWKTDEDKGLFARAWKELVFVHGPLTAVKPAEAGDMIHPGDSSQYTFKQNTVVVTNQNSAHQYIGSHWHDSYGLKFDDLESFTDTRVTVVFVP